jgi:hypothetical protein
MNGKTIFSLAGTTLVAGGLFVGSIGWAAAQETPPFGPGGPGEHGPGMMGPGMMGEHGPGMMGGMMGAEHAEMQATVAEVLGLTVEEFQAELAAGKTVPQIAEEQGVDLADLHEAVMAELPAHGG